MRYRIDRILPDTPGASNLRITTSIYSAQYRKNVVLVTIGQSLLPLTPRLSMASSDGGQSRITT